MGKSFRVWFVVGTACASFFLPGSVIPASAQDVAIGLPPIELVRLTVDNEVTAANNADIKHMFRSRKQTATGSQTRLYVETNDAMAAMLIAIDDHPLTAQQQQSETNHLAWLSGNPEQLRKKHAREEEDTERSLRIVKALPNAFLYEYAGTENADVGMGKPGSTLIRLRFKPNPSYSPPTRVEQVLGGMEGYLLIDPASRRLGKIDGTLTRDVTFGWGIIGHLDKGGTFVVKQAAFDDGSWDVTEIRLSIRGKILLFKTLRYESDETFSDFRRMPSNFTFAQGAEALAAERDRIARVLSAEGSGVDKNSH
jgi:hypothetical protein